MSRFQGISLWTGPYITFKKGDMNTKQGTQRLIIMPNVRTEWFSLVSHTMCSVIESVTMDLCRCRNSRLTAVLSRFPQHRVFGLTDADT